MRATKRYDTRKPVISIMITIFNKVPPVSSPPTLWMGGTSVSFLAGWGVGVPSASNVFVNPSGFGLCDVQ
jgi:hypothetical protein